MNIENTNMINVREDDRDRSVTMSARLPFDDVSSFIVGLSDHAMDNDAEAFDAFREAVDLKLDEAHRAVKMIEGLKAMIDAIDDSEFDTVSKWGE